MPRTGFVFSCFAVVGLVVLAGRAPQAQCPRRFVRPRFGRNVLISEYRRSSTL